MVKDVTCYLTETEPIKIATYRMVNELHLDDILIYREELMQQLMADFIVGRKNDR